MNMQYLQETVKEQKGRINPYYDISFNDLLCLYKKATIKRKRMAALLDAFIFGYAMGTQATRWEIGEIIKACKIKTAPEKNLGKEKLINQSDI